MKNNFEKILIVVIIVLSFFIKAYGLNKSPPSVNWDEASLGYNAYSILKTGRDEYGTFLPISLRSFNDYKPALYSYLSIPFIAVMGLNETSTRMVSTISGTVSLLFLYFFLKQFVKDKKLRWLIFGILAFEPWRMHFARVALEANLSACFFIIGAWFLYKYKKIKKQKNPVLKMILISFFFALAAYSYHGARAAVPAFIILFTFDPLKLFFVKNFKSYKDWFLKFRLKYFVLVLLFLMFIIPVFLANKNNEVLTRFRQENIFNRYFPFTPGELLDKNKNIWFNLSNNPIYYFSGLMAGHMLSYFSPMTLGGRVYHWVRRSVQYVPGFSMVGWLETLILVFGLIYLIKNIKTKFKNRFLVYWMLAGAAPAALTWNWFHPLRSLNLFPAVELLVALGFVYLSKYFIKTVYVLVIILFSLTIFFTIINEYNYSITENSGEYQSGGFKEGVPKLAQIQDSYDEIMIDSSQAQSYIFFLFYQSFDPKIVQKYADIRPKLGTNGDLSFDFYKYKFARYNWPEQKKKSKIIIWTSSEVLEDEINDTPNANLMWVSNALSRTAVAIITKD